MRRAKAMRGDKWDRVSPFLPRATETGSGVFILVRLCIAPGVKSFRYAVSRMMNAKIKHTFFVFLVRLYEYAWKFESERFADEVVGESLDIALAQGAAEQTVDFFSKFHIHRCLLSVQLLSGTMFCHPCFKYFPIHLFAFESYFSSEALYNKEKRCLETY